MDNRMREMTIFMALAETGDLERAARILDTKPASLAASLQALEMRLGVTLIDMSSSPYALTPPGGHYLALCQEFTAGAASRYHELLGDLARLPPS